MRWLAPPAAGDRVFLGGAQPRQGLAGVEQPGAGVGDMIDIVLDRGRGAGQQLDKVEGGAFTGQQGAGRPRELAYKSVPGGQQIAVVDQPVDGHGGCPTG